MTSVSLQTDQPAAGDFVVSADEVIGATRQECIDYLVEQGYLYMQEGTRIIDGVERVVMFGVKES